MKKFMASVMVLSCILGLAACDSTSTNDLSKGDETTTAFENIVEDGSTENNKTEETSDSWNYEIAVSYANWSDKTEIYLKALNVDKLMISSVLHLPIYKFDTLKELEQFKTDYKDVFSMDHGYDEIPSFNEVTASYDESFFENNTVMLVYVESSSGSDRYGVDSIYNENGEFCIYVKKINSPDWGTDDMAGWFINVVVPDDRIKEINEFDAIFGVSEK